MFRTTPVSPLAVLEFEPLRGTCVPAIPTRTLLLTTGSLPLPSLSPCG